MMRPYLLVICRGAWALSWPRGEGSGWEGAAAGPAPAPSHRRRVEALMAPLPLSPHWPQAPMPWDRVVRPPRPSEVVCSSRWKCQLLQESSPLSCAGAGPPSPSWGAQPCGVTPLCAVVLAHPAAEAETLGSGLPRAGAPQSLLKAFQVPGCWRECAAPSPTTAGAQRDGRRA